MTLSELIVELRNIVLVHPEAAQFVVESRTSTGQLSNNTVLRLKAHLLLVEGESRVNTREKGDK
jgi:hypothetical protein